MLPHEKRVHSVLGRTVRLGIMAGAALTAAVQQETLAHAVLLSRGTVVVNQNHIVCRIEIDAKDFIHYYQLRATAEGFSTSALREAVFEHRQHLLEHFLIRNASGELLRGKCVDVQWNETSQTKVGYAQLGALRAIYVLEYPIHLPPRYLTFQQLFGGQHAPMPVRLALSVTATGDETARFIQLTNRGNVETLEFVWPDSAAAKSIPAAATAQQTGHLGQDRFKSVSAYLHIEDTVVRCDIHIPLILLETWLPLRRASRDFIDAGEMAEARERLRAFFAGRNRIRINDRAAEPNGVQLSFLGPDASSIDEPQPQRLGVWSARVGVRLTYETDVPVNQVQLVWDLFNNAVFDATVTTVFGDSQHEKVVTAYSPNVSWSHR